VTHHSKKPISIFVTSPGDVMNERARLHSVVEQLNQGLANYLGVVLELKEWSQVAPNMGRGQQVIFDQLPVETWDVMIGILWLRYGMASGGANPSESGTHEEFRTAYECYQKTGKPRIMFYRCTRPPEDITKVNLEDLGKINAFFQEFEVGGKNQGFYKTYDTPENFERFVRDHLEKFLIDYSEKEKHQAVTPEAIQVYAPKIPNNLPRRAAFFGRAKEMDVVIRALSPADRTWGVLIDGIGGIGKSALAIEAAHRAQEAGAFDAFIFITAKQNILKPSGIQELTPPARTLDDFLNETARVLGQPGIPKLSSDEKRRALLDVLRAMRTLLIYDNLETLSKEDQEAMADFLRELPPACKAIITSRRRGGEGAVWLRVEKLDWDAARGIIENEMARDAGLANKLRRVESRWQELFDETSGSPLALVHTLGLMRVRTALTFENALAMLRGNRDADLQKFIFQEARKELTANDKTALGALSFFVPSATFEAWMQVANLSRNALETTIERLSALSLVDVLVGAERYALHPLTRTFVRDELFVDENVAHETGMRFAQYWINYAKQFGEGKESYKMYAWLETEWANLDEAANWLWKTADFKNESVGSKDAARMLNDLASAIDQFLWFNGRWEEQIQLSTRTYQISRSMHDWSIAGRRAFDLAWIYSDYARDIPDLANKWASFCAEVWTKAGNKQEYATSVRIRGLVARQRMNYIEAEQLLSEALAIRRDLEIETEVVIALIDLGGLAEAQVDYDVATSYYLDALDLAKRINN
jgi:hypothetical protein